MPLVTLISLMKIKYNRHTNKNVQYSYIIVVDLCLIRQQAESLYLETPLKNK